MTWIQSHAAVSAQEGSDVTQEVSLPAPTRRHSDPQVSKFVIEHWLYLLKGSLSAFKFRSWLNWMFTRRHAQLPLQNKLLGRATLTEFVWSRSYHLSQAKGQLHTATQPLDRCQGGKLDKA